MSGDAGDEWVEGTWVRLSTRAPAIWHRTDGGIVTYCGRVIDAYWANWVWHGLVQRKQVCELCARKVEPDEP